MIKRTTRRQKKYFKGQTLLEYAFLAVVLMIALMAIQQYISRGLQGKMAESIDSLGKQYDPQATIVSNRYTASNSETLVYTALEGPEKKTYRIDVSNDYEKINETITFTH